MLGHVGWSVGLVSEEASVVEPEGAASRRGRLRLWAPAAASLGLPFGRMPGVP
jgi:hypothetical protein